MTDAEMWRAHREEVQARNAVRRASGTAEIEWLPDDYTVQKLTDYQFRINGKVDVFPTHRKYHVLATGRRGSYGRENLHELLRRLL